MPTDRSLRFFDDQFRRQVRAQDFALNPFERLALPHLRGHVLDYGCGLGNLALAAARAGCRVVALDASATAIEHIRRVATSEGLPVAAELADLRSYPLAGEFDAVVSIGLLMFFDCPAAWRQLDALLGSVRPGGIVVVNVLIEGTTFMDMFAPEGHCLLRGDDLLARLAAWELLEDLTQRFDAPGGTQKVFSTLVARRPACVPPST